jgi:uroporphyrinogen-III synthase
VSAVPTPDPNAVTVLVVRPRAQALAWVEELTAIGVAARALPLIEILPAPEPRRVGEVFVEMTQLADGSPAGPGTGALPGDISSHPLLVFVSPNAVLGFFSAAAGGVAGVGLRVGVGLGVGAGVGIAWPANAWAAATGPGTVAALREAGVPDDRIVAPPPSAAQFDSEALWTRISGWRWTSRPVWIVRGNGGRDWLGQQMRLAGADVRVVQSYGRAAPALTVDERPLLAAAQADPARWVWMFSSSEAIDHLDAIAPDADWHAGRALASHPRIAQRAMALGFGAVTVVAPTPRAVAAALGAFTQAGRDAD